MLDLYNKFYKNTDVAPLLQDIEKLCKIECGQTFKAYREAADFTLRLLQKNGIPDAEIIDFPADGRTVYQDKRMPLAWDASVGKVTIDQCSGPCANDAENFKVIADFQQNPFALIKGSVWPENKKHSIRVITEQQLLAGEDPRDALVILEPFTWPRANVLKPIIDLGGLGIITDFLSGRYFDENSTQWVNASTECGDWHVTAEDRPFAGFSVSPKYGDFIRRAANSGGLTVKVECDGRRYEGTLPLVTAKIPGKTDRELWLFAHLYEPLLDDDAAGVVYAIELARQLMEYGGLNYSIRLIFAMELYGFAAYADYRGGNLHDQVIGGFNLDTPTLLKGTSLCLWPAGTAVPFIGNRFVREAYDVFKDTMPLDQRAPGYGDDMFISDATVGVPSSWLLGIGHGMWHNQRQCDPANIDQELFRKCIAVSGAIISKTACYCGEEPEKELFEVKKISSPWRDHASQMIFSRAQTGFPHSLANVPPDKRTALPDGVLYGPFGTILSNMDGKKDLAHLIAEAEAELQTTVKEAAVKKYADSMNFLADYGYLNVIKRPEISEAEIAAALAELGIKQDDLLLVHASISKCGYIRGGAKTIIEAVVKSSGNAAFTAFTRPYIYLGGVNKMWNYRPYDPADPSQVWTGEIGKTALTLPGAFRSRHITHSWVGFGEKAHQALALHGETDSPAGASSPMAQALKLKGKILYFGCGIAPTTYLHHLEDICDLPFLDTAVCRYRCADGSLKTAAIEKHLPGHRDFYRPDAENCKFFSRAIAAGLQISSVKLGMGYLQLIDIASLHEIGMELVKADKRIFLCDDPDCTFCRNF